ncbi:MAG: hypothetical protein PHE83_05885 [Opitutaceae bacterium]|nr:hypothetical protein [Opitutaceae bacterium]
MKRLLILLLLLSLSLAPLARNQQLVSDLNVQRTIKFGTLAAGTITPAQLTADQNDFNPTGLASAFVVRLSSDASRNITGLVPGTAPAGRMLILCNVGAQPIVLADESGSSTTANRFAFSGDYTLAADTAAWLVYDDSSTRWRLIQTTSATLAATYQPLDATLTALAGFNTNGMLAQTAADTFAGRTIAGTADRISVTNGDGAAGNPTLDIAATYAGQTSITTLGTIGAGTWQGSVIGGAYGGTGAANTGKTITLGGSLTTSGAYDTTLTVTGATNVTLPTAGTLATLANAVPLLKPYALAPTPCLVKTGADTIAVAANTKVIINGTMLVTFASQTAATIDTGSITIGTDYAVYATNAGTAVFSANFSAPSGYTTTTSQLIGGFHYAPGGNAHTTLGDGPILSRGTTDTAIASTAFDFSIGGTWYAKAAVPAGTAIPAETVTADKWALYRLSIIADGTITVTPAAGNVAGYADEASAITALPALPGSSAAMGYITVQTKTGFAWIAGTDALAGGSSGNVANATNYYPESASGAQINEYSIWDLKFRPACADPRGMTLIAGGFWMDIYICGTSTDVAGSSKYGSTIADGASPPKIPAAFGGNGTTTYGTLTWFEASELAAAYGKQLPSYSELIVASYGVTEQTSRNLEPSTTQLDAPRTSKWGVMQATGNIWVWMRDLLFIPHTTALTGTPPADADFETWINVSKTLGGKSITESRGSVYTYGNNGISAGLFGGPWYNGSYAGSRASDWGAAPSASGNNIGARFACDHLVLP